MKAVFWRLSSIASITAVLLAWTFFIPGQASGCPFCAAVSQTFSEEIEVMDTVVVAKLAKLPPTATTLNSAARAAEVAKTRFEIIEIIKGDAVLSGQKYVDAIYFGEGKVGQEFLLMGVDPPKLNWSTPLKVSAEGRKYLSKLLKLPKEGAKRLEFFQDYLEHKDEMLARDAYDEFARASYAAVITLKDRMRHDQLVEWIKDPDIPASRRRLYFTMLGVCGSEMSDAVLLETMLKSNDRKMKAGLDAMIGCYLTLCGAKGMPLIEDLFLRNKDAEYADTYAAIMALRFHGTETDVIPRKRILQGIRHMLDRPQLADLVIPDLARWEDWSVMDKLVQLFKDADEKSSWVRVPVINYLRVCPDPQAKKYLKELKKLDPATFKRANTFFPFGPGSVSSPTPKTKASSTDSAQSDRSKTENPAGEDAASEKSRKTDQEKDATAAPVEKQGGLPGGVNLLVMVGVACVVGAALVFVFWNGQNAAKLGSPSRRSM